MDKIYYVVSYPITIPIGDYCWNINTHAICKYFNSSGGQPECELQIAYNLKYDINGGVLKSEKCKLLIPLQTQKDENESLNRICNRRLV